MGSCRRVEPFSCHQRCQVPLSPTHSSLKGTDPPRWLYGLRRLHASGPALPIPSGTAGDHCHILSYPINMSLCENLKLSKWIWIIAMHCSIEIRKPEKHQPSLGHHCGMLSQCKKKSPNVKSHRVHRKTHLPACEQSNAPCHCWMP